MWCSATGDADRWPPPGSLVIADLAQQTRDEHLKLTLLQSSPDWRAGHDDAPVGPTMKGSPRPRFASDTATGAPRSRTFRVREGVS